MPKIRVACFIDGFNLYHAIDDLARFPTVNPKNKPPPDPSRQYLKWVDLRRLTEHFVDLEHQEIVGVYYFSAFANHRPPQLLRHREYVKALESVGVQAQMGYFKRKDRYCRKCGALWKSHEEKETDVNLALSLLRGAWKMEYDRALIVSSDSDLAPPVRMARDEFPNLEFRVLAPPGRFNSKAIVNAAGGKKQARRLLEHHISHSLLPAQIVDGAGQVLSTRPPEYEPPAS